MGWFIPVASAALSYLSARSSRRQAKSQASRDEAYRREQDAKLEEQKEVYRNMDLINPYAGTQNAYAGLETDFSNLAAGAQNTYAGAQNAYAGLQNQFAGLKNMYSDMENRFEDATVDMRAADLQTQQSQQQRANILQGLRRTAGSSGVAGLAQTLANQGALQSQQIAAGVSQQERQNQMLAMQEGARIDQLQRGAGMQLQQLQAQGATQLQAQQAAGAMSVQQMKMAGASEQQRLRLAGAQQARGLGVARENLIAQGDWQADMARRQGEAMLQEAEMSRQATLLGMSYGQSAGANQQSQMSNYNSLQASTAANQQIANSFSSLASGDINWSSAF